MKYQERHTINDRILEWLWDIHHQIEDVGDAQVRMIYSAMTYRLNYSHIGAAKKLRLIRKKGWEWEWIGKEKPSARMALRVRRAYDTNRLASYNHKNN